MGERHEEAVELLLSDPQLVAWLEPDERVEEDEEEVA